MRRDVTGRHSTLYISRGCLSGWRFGGSYILAETIVRYSTIDRTKVDG